MSGVRMINGLILAILGYRQSELGMRAAYSKLRSPEEKLIYKQEVPNSALILIKMLRKKPI